MQITFSCDNCGTEMEADSSLFGSSSECPSCAEPISVPQPVVGPGTTLGGFTIEEHLGKGAMGEVYLARQLAMDRMVALKVLPAQFSADKERVDRFLQEARMSAKLDHPNIVTVLDAGEDTGYYYLAMQYVKGETVEDRVKRFGRLDEKEALNVCLKIASGLGRAWSRHQMLHRDIKPANIMVDEFGEPKLLDMGLAKTMLEESKLTVTGMIVGTPLFMSPEQGKGIPMDCRADIYSLGATLYAMVTGAPPYQADSVVAILAKHAFDPVPDPRRRNRELTEGCSQVIELMMAKDVADRLQDWDAVTAAIKEVRAGRTPAGGKPRLAAAGAPSTSPQRQPTRAAATKMGDHSQSGDETMAMPMPEGEAKKKSPLMLAVGVGLGVGVLGAILLIGLLAAGAKKRQQPQPQPTPVVQQDPTPVPTPPTPTPTPAVTPTPTPTPAPTPSSEPSRSEQAATRMAAFFRSADRYLQRNPNGQNRVIEMYEKLLPQAVGTPYEAEVERRLQAVKESKRQAIDTHWRRMSGEAEALVAAGKGEDALNLLRSYQGTWAAETQARRSELIDALAPRIAAAKTPEPAQETAADRRATLARQVATSVFGGDLAGADNRLEIALRDPNLSAFRTDFQAAREMIAQLAALPTAHLSSFAGRSGEVVELTLKDGSKQTLRITGVENGNIAGNEQIVLQSGTKGWGKVASVPYSDLHYSERLKLVGKSSEPWNLVARALLAVEARNYDWASKALASAKTPLAEMLTVGMESLAGDSRNMAARQEVTRLLEVVGLPMDDRFAVLRTLYTQGIDAGSQAAIRPQVETFLNTYADTPVGAEYGGLLAVIAGQVRSPSGTLPVLPADETPVAITSPWQQRAAEAQRQQATLLRIPREVVNREGIRLRLVPRGLATGDGYEPEPFYLSVTEITEAQWQAVTGHARGGNRADMPVQDVRWHELLGFIGDIRERENRRSLTYRLPTFNEWRYAARAGLDSDYPWTGGVDAIAQYANHLDASAPGRIGNWDTRSERGPASDGQATLAPVASYPANPLGLHDMTGNVLEYTLDISRFPDLEVGGASERRLATQIEQGELSLLSGGCWFLSPANNSLDVAIPLADAKARLDGASSLGGVGMRMLMSIEDLEHNFVHNANQQTQAQPQHQPPQSPNPQGSNQRPPNGEFSLPPRDSDRPQSPDGRRLPPRQ